MVEPTVEIHLASKLDHAGYAAFQRAAFADLLRRRKVSDAHLTPRFFRWKYRTPDGIGRVATVTRNGEIVSASAILPLSVSVDGVPIKGWHCVDVATVPEERRRGHFSRCLSALASSVPAGEVLFAFPNEGSLGVFLELGFVENVVVTTWVMPRVRLMKNTNAAIREVDVFGTDHDLAAACFGTDRPFIDRRPDYLQWRYRENPSNDYLILSYERGTERGLCVMRRARVMNREVALVMELMGTGPLVQAALLRHAAGKAHSAGLRTLALMSTWVPAVTALRAGLVPVPARLLPKRQVLVVRAGDREVMSMAKRKWLVQTGDWDVF